MSILNYFSKAERDKRELQSDSKRLSALRRLADRSVNVMYVNNGIWVTVDGTPTLRVTSKSDIGNRAISIEQVDAFVRDLRDDWISSHKDDRIDIAV